MPLPPYIKRAAEESDAERYQTVYARDPGSVAAPTAGLHFTQELLDRIQAQGVEIGRLTLQVSLGTFRPVQVDRVEDHVMHTEWYHISSELAESVCRARANGRRIVCVGTTSLRSLESASEVDENGGFAIRSGWAKTDIFIYPGYQFKACDALITNFHLPKSTLLMLVSAFYQREALLEVYQLAVREGYRFFSYGDAMMIAR
jgi:S-adenosylmethionine:tRNA ribosyltransferase-isomerase